MICSLNSRVCVSETRRGKSTQQHGRTQGTLPGFRPRTMPWGSCASPVRASSAVAPNDYSASSLDIPLLQLPPTKHLAPPQLADVFGYPRDFRAKYTLGKLMGRGGFGDVNECTEKETGTRFAVKTLAKVPRGQKPTPRHLLKLRAEVEIARQLGASLDVVNFKEVFEDEKNVYVIMQLCEGGALLEQIEKESYSEKRASQMIRSVLRFVSQCHAKGYIYRDVKPDNFLFLNKEPGSPLKAIDFGLAVKYKKGDAMLTVRSGTPLYMAPEVVTQSYDEKADLWSVGMLTYQLLTGQLPFRKSAKSDSVQDILSDILSKQIDWEDPALKDLTPEAIDFMQKLLSRSPVLRPSATEALSHPWIKDEAPTCTGLLEDQVVQRLQRFSTFGMMKQMVLQMVFEEMIEKDKMISLSNEDEFIEKVQTIYDHMDADSNGYVDMGELHSGLSAMGFDVVDTVGEFRKVDLNCDGKVSVDELMTALLDWNVVQRSGQWKKYLDRAFSKFDTDGDGSISLDELIDYLNQARGGESSPEVIAEAKKMMREADSNGDGMISREEFAEMLAYTAGEDELFLYDPRLDRRGS